MNPKDDFTQNLRRGMFYDKKTYSAAILEPYEKIRPLLPEPVLDSRPLWLKCYSFAVETAFQNRKKPTVESGFVSNFVDAAFNENIFLWDTAFITMFCNLLHPHIPGICSLDNFYCRQFDDGEIPRELVRDSGRDFLPWVNAYNAPLYSYFHNAYGHRRLKTTSPIAYESMFKPDLGRVPEKTPYLTLDNLNHPIAAWAEWISYLHTGDIARLQTVVIPLLEQYKAMQYHLRHQNGLYVTDWASMDNSPRNRYLGCGLDISCEMVLFADNLADMLDEIERVEPLRPALVGDLKHLREDSGALANTINALLWDNDKGFYFDLSSDGKRAPVKTVAAYWALAAGVASPEQAERLVMWLNDTETFNRVHRVPSLAADEAGYNPDGGYWSGSVWAPTNTMVLYGLEKYGYPELAKEIALNHLRAVCDVYEETGTIWENYPADSITKGDADKGGFVGWSGIAPILYLIQYAVGLTADCRTQTVEWKIDTEHILKGEAGCRRYWFFGKQADFIAKTDGNTLRISITTDDSFSLKIHYNSTCAQKDIRGDISFSISS